MAQADVMIHFALGQDLPQEELMQNLNVVGRHLADNPFSTALIQGHADSTGQAAANVQLSRRRAESIKQYFILHWNIAPERLEIEALGDTVPLADNATAQGRALNRRVELFLRDPLPGPAIARAAAHPALLREQLHFASNAVQPQTVDTQALERIQTFLDANPQAVVLIQGHSDGMGDAARNYVLSEQRAQNVMLTLNQRFNIPMQRMRTVAHGEGAPLAPNDTASGRILNRRVEVICGPADAIGWDAALLL